MAAPIGMVNVVGRRTHHKRVEGAAMRYFAGLDVSLEETAICVVDETGRIMKEVRAASEPSSLVAALQRTGLPLERIGLEACSLTAWLHEGLRQAGLRGNRERADRHRRRTRYSSARSLVRFDGQGEMEYSPVGLVLVRPEPAATRVDD